MLALNIQNHNGCQAIGLGYFYVNEKTVVFKRILFM